MTEADEEVKKAIVAMDKLVAALEVASEETKKAFAAAYAKFHWEKIPVGKNEENN